MPPKRSKSKNAKQQGPKIQGRTRRPKREGTREEKGARGRTGIFMQQADGMGQGTYGEPNRCSANKGTDTVLNPWNCGQFGSPNILEPVPGILAGFMDAHEAHWSGAKARGNGRSQGKAELRGRNRPDDEMGTLLRCSWYDNEGTGKSAWVGLSEEG
ncbi:hypothetical protein B0H11DRAFT_1899619 [Mycena galericulata]|nr:hypothetical protein B0H11DRAFT_1899619 [Mycena galericulata]